MTRSISLRKGWIVTVSCVGLVTEERGGWLRVRVAYKVLSLLRLRMLGLLESCW